MNTAIRTKLGVFSVHQIAPVLFNGFDWYQGDGHFLIAEPEKALIDSLYLSSRKKKRFGSFPELHFPPEFSFKKAAQWAKRIPEEKIRLHVLKKLKAISRIDGNAHGFLVTVQVPLKATLQKIDKMATLELR